MAGLDLIIPYLTKEAIDRYIITSTREVVLKRDQSAEEERFLSRYGKDLIPKKEKGKFLLSPEGSRSMDRKELAVFSRNLASFRKIDITFLFPKGERMKRY